MARTCIYCPALVACSWAAVASAFAFPGSRGVVPALHQAPKVVPALRQAPGREPAGIAARPARALYAGGGQDGARPAKEGDVGRGEGDSPAGLSLEGVYKRLKVEVQNLDDGIVGLDSRDQDYGVEIVKTKLSRDPSLGIELIEVARAADGRGLVLVGGLVEGGSAQANGKIAVGDTLTWVGVEPTDMTRVEAVDWDTTVGALSKYTDQSEITLVLKRLVRRADIDVVFELPEGEERRITVKAGSNLRTEMIRNKVEVYDDATKRYDQPYATGNCAGEGICGTCFVEVRRGEELVTAPDDLEKMVMSRGSLPVRWRLSCRTVVGADNTPGELRLRAQPQSTWLRERRSG